MRTNIPTRLQSRRYPRRVVTLGGILLGVGILCFLLYTALDKTVDERGFVHEHFALLPLGYIFSFAGVLSSARRNSETPANPA